MCIQMGVYSEFEDHMRPTNFEALWMRPSTSLLCSALFFEIYWYFQNNLLTFFLIDWIAANPPAAMTTAVRHSCESRSPVAGLSYDK